MADGSIVISVYDTELWEAGKSRRMYERIAELGYLHEIYVGVARLDNDKWNKMIKWCEENNIPAITTSLYFYFINEEDAMGFKLRWIT